MVSKRFEDAKSAGAPINDEESKNDELKRLIKQVLREEAEEAERTEEDKLSEKLSSEGWAIVRFIEMRAERRAEEDRRMGLTEEERLTEDVMEDENLHKVLRLIELRERKARRRSKTKRQQAIAIGGTIAAYVIPLVAATVKADRDSRSLKGKLRKLLS